MIRFRLLTTASAAALALAGPLHADVTAQDIWQDWQSYMQSFGYTMTGTEAASGDTLTVTDIDLSVDIVEEDDVMGTLLIEIPQMVFAGQGDGTVTVSMAERSDVVFSSADGAPEDVRVVMAYDNVGFDMTASGDPTAVRYDYSVDRAGLTMVEMTVDGETMSSDMFNVALNVVDITGRTDLSIGDLRTYVQNVNTGAVTASLAFDDPTAGEKADVAYTSAGFAMTSTASVPSGGLDIAGEMTAALRAGLAVDASFTSTGGATDFAFDGADGAGTVNMSTDASTIGVKMSEGDGLGYNIAYSGMTLNMLIPDLPIPVQAAMEGLNFDIKLPVVASDESQDFALVTELNGLTISDAIWGMFDPGAALPRDPATVQIGLTGQAKVLLDYMDPAQQQAMASSGAMPAELQSLNLTNLVVDLAGAALTGTGAFTVTPGMSPLMGPLGTPVGEVNLRLEGGNGLMDTLVQMGLLPQDQAMDTLVQMGLLPQDQAMGARMMLGLFARPVEGEADTLTSQIEINEQGHILANGQRIQ